LLFHIFDGSIVNDEIVMLTSQQLEKVDPTFGFSAFEPGKKVVSDMGAVTVGAVMPCAGIVYVDIA
jgi:hypothetical protein